MHLLNRNFRRLLIAGLLAAGLLGCQPAPADNQRTFVPRVPPTAQAAPAQELQATTPNSGASAGYPAPTQAGYPAPGASDTTPTTASYPAPGGTGPSIAAPAVENFAKISATLIETAPDPDNASYTRLHVQILKVEDVESTPNFARDLVNKEGDLYMETSSLPSLNPGDGLEALVSYRGDESGGKFFVMQISKLP